MAALFFLLEIWVVLAFPISRKNFILPAGRKCTQYPDGIYLPQLACHSPPLWDVFYQEKSSPNSNPSCYWLTLTCCAAKRQQSRAPHRELLIKDYGHLKGPYGYWKNWAWWAASPTRWARAGPQSWKIGTFWWTLANFALFWLAHNFPSHQAPCLESPNQLRNLCPIKRFNWGSHFRGPGQKIWNSIFGSETENNHSGRAKFNEK